MRITCSDCGAAYNLRAKPGARYAKCKKCGALMALAGASAAAPPERDDDAPYLERGPRKKALLVPAILVAVVSFLLALIFIPLTLFAGFGSTVVAATGEASTEEVQLAFYVVAVLATIAVCLAGSGVGLLLRKSWGWWGAVVVYGFFLLLNLKMLAPVLAALNWDHPKAVGTATFFGLLHGLPILLSLAMIVLLALPRMRIAYGIKQQPIVRHRKAGTLRSR